jgi:hypothetical protein
MDSVTFQLACRRTVPAEHRFWDERFVGDREEARKQLLTNAVLGMSGEAREIHDEPTSDECGDGYWYAYTLLTCLEIEGIDPVPEGTQAELYHAACVCAELVKKIVFHGRPFRDCRPALLDSARKYLNAVASIDPRNEPGPTFQQNVDKLQNRYPDGWVELG